MASYVLIMLMIAMIVTRCMFSDTHDAEVDQLLKKLNKPAIKSIKSPDGDIIDCVDIYKQPAFDHPLLKGHTVEMKPSFYPDGWNNVSSNTEKHSNMVTQLWTINGRCPKNTVPIRRTRKEEILRVKSIERFGKKDQNNITLQTLRDYATVKVQGRFNGGKANINVWKPALQNREEFSLAQIWIVASGGTPNANTIEVGWQTYPHMYGDFNPRFFIYWTRNGYGDTGCYNLLCPGFVMMSEHFVPGAVINPTSIYNGDQIELIVSIQMDTRSGHWWLEINRNLVGYWPASLFTLLAHGAPDIIWGGEITNKKIGGRHTTTQMGSGHFAQEGFKKASYFKNVEIVDERNIWREPILLPHMVTDERCYNLLPSHDRLWGSYFFYGGPGRNLNCP